METMPAHLVRLDPLEPRRLLTAQVNLAADIASGLTSTDIREGVRFNGAVYFTVYPPSGGSTPQPGIWRSDGTSQGTYVVVPGIFSDLAVVHGELWMAGRTW